MLESTSREKNLSLKLPLVVMSAHLHRLLLLSACIYGWLIVGAARGQEPTITSQPLAQQVVLGATAEFFVRVGGVKPLTIRWQRDDLDLENSPRVSGVTGDRLTINGVEDTDMGSYSVVVSNAFGTVTSGKVTLRVVEVVRWGLSKGNESEALESLSGVVAIAAGNSYDLALQANGRILAWGNGMPAPELRRIQAIAAGGGHGLALQAGDTVFAWGENGFGQARVPLNLSNVGKIAAGGRHSLALRQDGTVVAWGDNDVGQARVPTELTRVVAIAAGRGQSLALRADGTVVGWGYHTAYCLGDDTQIPATVPAKLTNVVAISAGRSHSLALSAAGTVTGWGDNSSGQISIPAGLTNVVEIAAGGAHSLALRANGTVAAWGANSFGERTVPPGSTNLTAIAAGWGYSLGLASRGIPSVSEPPVDRFGTVGGRVYFKVNVSGSRPLQHQWQLNGADLPAETNALLSLGNLILEQAGRYSVRLSNSFGSVTADIGNLSILPAWIVSQPESQSIAIGGSAHFSVGIEAFVPSTYQWWFNGMKLSGETNTLLRLSHVSFTSTGRYSLNVSNSYGSVWSDEAKLDVVAVAAWGANDLGQCNVPGSLTNAVAIAAGGNSSLALREDGTVVAWGNNEYGQTNVPEDLTNAVAIAADWSHSLALRADGTVVAWGSNADGQTDVPAGLKDVVGIHAGPSFSLALRSDGSTVAWGHSAGGGTTIASGLKGLVGLAGGYHPHVYLGLRADGKVIGGADNGSGHSNPNLAEMTNAVAVSARGSHALILRSDGTVVAKGNDDVGQSSVPEGLRDVIAIASGPYNNLALRADGRVVGWGVPNDPQALANLSQMAAVAIGERHSLGLIAQGKPFIMTPNSDRIGVIGGVVYFEANASGARPLRYQWRFNGADLPGETNTVLALKDLRMGHSGEYSVRVANAFGAATNRGGRLSVVPLWISSQPVSQSLLIGEPASFFVAVESSAPVAYQWWVNGIELQGETSPTLRIHHVTLESNGSYSVTVSNAYEMVSSDEALLSPSVMTHLPKGDFVQIPLPKDLTNVVEIASSGTHELALRTDGTVAAWGPDAYGQNTVPAGLTNVIAIAAGSGHSLALRADGGVVGWGRNDYGQSTVPAGLANAVMITAGATHSLALRSNGTVIAWGNNDSLQATVPEGLANVVSIAAGRSHSLALLADHTVEAWGFDFGGAGTVPASVTNAVAIAAGAGRSIALLANRTVVVWGLDDSSSYSSVHSGLKDIVAIADGGYSKFALATDNTVVHWHNEVDGITSTRLDLTNVVAIAAGEYGVGLALLGAGKPFITTQNADRSSAVGGKVFFQTSASGARPLSYQWRFDGIELPDETNAVLALKDLKPRQTGRYSVMVSNHLGSATSGSASLFVTPARISTQPESQSIPIGAKVLLSVEVESHVPSTYQWWFDEVPIPGENNLTLRLNPVTFASRGQYSLTVSNSYGTIRSFAARLHPVVVAKWGDGIYQVPGDLTNVIAIAAGRGHNLALRENGMVVAWGRDESGQADVPEELRGVVAIAAGGQHSLALRDNGTVVAWGSRDFGQTDYGQSRVPENLTNVVSIAAGWGHSLALRADGSVVAWGLNQYGQASIPTGLRNVVAIAAGGSHSLALRGDGTIILWGETSSGVGKVPPNLTNVVAISAGSLHNLALRAGGTLTGWGDDHFPSSLPVGLTDIAAIASGTDHNLVLRSDGTVIAWGFNESGQNNVPKDLTNIVAIADGLDSCLALVGNGSPHLTSPMADRSGLAGGSAYFQASAVGAHPLAYQWQHAGSDLPNATNATLVLNDLRPEQAGDYSVRVSNALGTAISRRAHLSVNSMAFLTLPRDQIVRLGETLSFTVKVESFAPVTYRWFVNGNTLPGATGPSLTLTQVAKDSAGPYVAVASNIYGSVTSSVARLTVWEPLQLSVEGRGRAEVEAGPYDFGDVVRGTATAERWAAFSHWSDGNRDNPRGFVIGVTNRYTAIFTNLYPMERWTDSTTGLDMLVPEGTPKLYVNDQLTFGGSFTFPDTNHVEVRLESSFDPSVLYFSLDGSPPEAGYEYTGSFPVTESSSVQATALDLLFGELRPTDPVFIGFLPTLHPFSKGGGNITAFPLRAAYPSNAVVTLTATASNGWQFLYFAGDASSTNSTTQVTMDRTRRVEAVFGTFLTHGVFGDTNSGHIVRDPSAGPYAYGSSVELSGVPAPGKYFSAWLDAASGQTNNPLSFTLTNANPTVRGLFSSLPPNTFALTVLRDGNGTIDRSEVRKFYTNGTTVTLTALPKPNQSFVGWSGDASGTQNPLPVVMDRSKTITAHFISTIAPVVQLVSPTPGDQQAAPGTFTIEAEASDPDGTVAKVEFWVDSSLLAVRNQRPFAIEWSEVPVGSYQLTAVAYDNSGLKRTSSPITVTVNPPARFRFDKAAYAVGEGDGSVTVEVVNDGVHGGTVDYELVSISAQAGLFGSGDFEYAKGTLTFTNGQTHRGIVVRIHEDYLPEEVEALEVLLRNPSAGTSLLQPSVAQVFIADNDQDALTNSWFDLRVPDPVPTAQGRLRVQPSPEEAQGQWRFPWELNWRTPQLVSLASGNYDLEFRSQDGWEPQARTLRVSVLKDRTVTVTNEYFQTQLSRRGNLTVNLGPDQPEIRTNAGWRLAQSGSFQWLGSGSTLSNLSVGLHLIEFRPVQGWFTPARRMVEVFEANNTPLVSENYLLAEPLPANVLYPQPLSSFGTITNSLAQDPQLPYALVGQLQTDVGFGSGIAVQEQVVLTAAHLLFNDQTLSWVEDVSWFFEKHEGEHSPKPLRPRGAHLLAGYAAARTNALLTGLLPGQSSSSSRLWDAATLYFWEPAARNGYSGYLTSDSQNNPWLISTKPKLLLGYPLESPGSLQIEPGRMHATTPTNCLFIAESSRVFLSSDFLSFPGNSGGPLCVLYEHQRSQAPDATYYPAGIYLGSVGSKSAVRAIDRDVVNLIQVATESANFGKNFTGGGVFPFGAPNLPGLKLGYLQIKLEPECIAEAGARWWVEGDTNLFSTSQAVAGIESKYTVRFGGIPGYLAPSQQTVSVKDKTTNTVTAVYRPIQGSGLQVKLDLPPELSPIARWSVKGQPNQWVSGTTLSLLPCDYEVAFAPVAGYVTPEPQRVSLSYGQTNVVGVTYRPLVLLSVSSQGGLKLSGVKGATYEIQVRPDLSAKSVWSNAWTITLSADEVPVDYLPPNDQKSLFYRAVLR